MRKYICISGKAQHGKDTLGRAMKDHLESKGFKVLIAHYGDLLKYICKTFLDWNGKKDEAGRTLLQQVGTEVVRRQQPNFWVEFIEKITKMMSDRWDYIIIPDARFPNEVYGLQKDDSVVIHIRVVRDGFVSPLNEEQQHHLSETALDNVPRYCTVHNNGTIDELSEALIPLVDEIIKEYQ